jgi:hypothetical protein
MSRIIRTTVASGVIGQYDHEWTVIRQYDPKSDSECYELFINREHIVTINSVVEALAILVEEFTE